MQPSSLVVRTGTASTPIYAGTANSCFTRLQRRVPPSQQKFVSSIRRPRKISCSTHRDGLYLGQSGTPTVIGSCWLKSAPAPAATTASSKLATRAAALSAHLLRTSRTTQFLTTLTLRVPRSTGCNGRELERLGMSDG